MGQKQSKNEKCCKYTPHASASSEAENRATKRFLEDLMAGKYYAPDNSGNILVFGSSCYLTGTPPPTHLYLQRVFNSEGVEIPNPYETNKFPLDYVRRNNLTPISREVQKTLYGMSMNDFN